MPPAPLRAPAAPSTVLPISRSSGCTFTANYAAASSQFQLRLRLRRRHLQRWHGDGDWDCGFAANYADGSATGGSVATGYAYGGAIYGSARVTASGCTFLANYAQGSRPGGEFKKKASPTAAAHRCALADVVTDYSVFSANYAYNLPYYNTGLALYEGFGYAYGDAASTAVAR